MTDRVHIPVAIMPSPYVITMHGRCSAGAAIARTGTTISASGTNPFNANEQLAFPFQLDCPTTIYKAAWMNGSAAGGNFSVAVYDADFKLLAQTASTAGSGNSVPQVAALTSTVKLPPGLYYAALAHDSTTNNRVHRWTVTNVGTLMWNGMGCWREGSVTVGSQPATATPVACTNVGFPHFGLITRSGYDL